MCSNTSSSSLSPDLQKYRFLNENEVAALTGRAVQTLRNDRHRGQGFPYVKYGRSVRYCLSDVLAAMDSRRVKPEAL